MLPAIKRRVLDFLLAVLDAAAAIGALSGAAFVALLGKLMLAVVLGAISLGFFLRLMSRRGTGVAKPAPLSAGYYLAAALGACVEVALLVEAVNLPVRFHQEGFEPYHWLIVLLGLVAAFAVNLHLARSLRKKEHAPAP